MTSAQIQKLIIRALRHGPLNHFDIAKEIDQAPFRVRAELKVLKRDRVVWEVLTVDEHVWKLSSRGEELATQADQLELIR